MASSSSPLLFNYLSPSSSSSKSLHFSILVPKIQDLHSSRAQKLRICCSSQTSHADTKNQINHTKKKQKPRPSFLEQIQDKWSVKTTSLREKFPWQEQKRESIEEVAEQELKFSGVVLSEAEVKEKSLVNDEESSGSRIKVSLAPWVHGNQLKLPAENTSLQGSAEKSKIVDGFGEKNLNRHVNFDSDKFDKTPFGQSHKNDVLVRNGKLSSIDEEFRFDIEKEEKVVEHDLKQSKVSRRYENIGTDRSDSFIENTPDIVQELIHVKGFSDANGSVALPWQVESGGRVRKSNAELAEKTIPEPELKRLRNAALRMVERTKVGAAGVTQALVDSIHEKWKTDEIVKLRFEGPSSHNMKRIHEILESRTGGLVIWRSGSSIVLYRGISYKLPCVRSFTTTNHSIETTERPRIGLNKLSTEETIDLSELNLLLDEIGPRYKDWSGREPLPVDADLLPAVIPGYRPPLRRLPYGSKRNLKDKEMTYVRRTARIMPPHFALGRNKELQGLAMAMVKLWKRSAIAKIAIKRGVQNTNNDRMAEELKVLTGGTLLSRNKNYIVFYRGNDFLSPRVAEVLLEAEKQSSFLQDEEEQARQKAATLFHSAAKTSKRPLVAGTLSETMAATSRWSNQPSIEETEKMIRNAAVARHASLVKYLEEKLALAKGKVKKAEYTLQKLQGDREPAELPTDLETLSSEERFLFRKMGHSMKPFLLIGRRDVFDGTIENMHLHWKYRELVKIIVGRRTSAQAKHIALTLEAESGGLLVSIDKTIQGFAIILYRGKNYQRPTQFRPKSLLTKRQALARSIELQRREALKHHISELHDKIQNMKAELEDMEMVEEIDEETLYSRLDAYGDEGDVEESEGGEKL